MAIGELELLPAVRKSPTDWLIIADGFSCREQISQGTGRHALHLAEVLQMALTGEHLSAGDSFPEAFVVEEQKAAVARSMRRTGAGLALVGLGALLWKRSQQS